MQMDIALIWAGIIAFGVFMYVFMDGFDLGIGILFPFAPGSEDRDLMMKSVAPIWDANETWLVLGGTGLLGAFPLAYSVILPALYIPLSAMLIALIFRGVAFEFRFKARTSRPLWGMAFATGSITAAFCQGVVLGAFVQGFEVQDRTYVGGMLIWLTPFSIMTGLGLVGGYAMLGCTWLIMKATGRLQDWGFRLARPLLAVVLIFIAVVSVWTPLMNPEIATRWFSWPNILFLSPVPVLMAILAFLLFRAIGMRRDSIPFVMTLGLFLLSYLGLGISLWPNVVPPEITIWQASAAHNSQLFLLVGTAIVIPAILAYTAFSYYIFRGKVSGEMEYG